MACVPIDEHTFEQSFELRPRDYLNHFLTLISTLRGGQERYLPMLLAKINEVFPNTTLPIAPAPFAPAAAPAPVISLADDLYKTAASLTQPLKPEPQESPRQLPHRFGSNSSTPYADSNTPPMPPPTQPYQNFSTAMGYPEATHPTPPARIYQTHPPGYSGFRPS